MAALVLLAAAVAVTDMKKITSLSLLAAAASMAVAEDKISLQNLQYEESDQRIKVDDWVLSAELNPDVDNQITVNAGLDTISGASPAWQPRVALERPDNLADVNAVAASPVYGYDPAGYDVVNVPVPDEHRRSFGLGWLTRDKQRNELFVGADYSSEPDYISRAVSASYLWFTDASKNTSLTIGSSLQSNRSLVFNEFFDTHWEDLTAFNLELGISQVVSPRSVLSANVFALRDSGYLTNHYQTILRLADINDDGVFETLLAAEHRPDLRRAAGTSLKWMMQWQSYYATHTGYRFYYDDWGIQSHTLDFKQYLTVMDELTLSLVWRYYDQTEADFYKDPDSQRPEFALGGFGSSDHRMGEFSAQTFELGAAYDVTQGITLNAQVGDYDHSTDFSASWVAVGITFKR
ncbi:DUF3570 domain-containing protein [Bacterioplanoides sp.]|uniref:DUF3570 domain-containing protein n=2 Tax=Bacterioplanoides sp. TaxID=2066072 RepID=UPI003B00DB85